MNKHLWVLKHTRKYKQCNVAKFSLLASHYDIFCVNNACDFGYFDFF